MTSIIDCKGHIKWKDKLQKVNFEIVFRDDGNFEIKFEPIPISQKTSWLFELKKSNKRLVEQFSLIARNTLEEKVSTKSAYFTDTSVQIGTKNDYFTFQATASELFIEHSTSKVRKSVHTQVEYITIGQLGFELAEHDTPLGKIKIRGPVDLKDYNKRGCPR